MVRIQCRVSKKRYLKSKRTYEYKRMSLPIPKKFHETVKPFLEHDLNQSIVLEKGSLAITLTPVKTFRHAGNTLQETSSENKSDTEFQH